MFDFFLVLMGFGFGLIGFYLIQRIRLRSFEQLAETIIQHAESEAERKRQKIDLLLKEKELHAAKEIELAYQQERKKILKEEERLQQREDKIETRLSSIEKKWNELEKKEHQILRKKEELEAKEQEIQNQEKAILKQLESLSGISQEQAKETLLSSLKEELSAHTSKILKQNREECTQKADEEAARIISSAIYRMASSTVSEITTCTVALPNDELKGRIIGREGRNIRTFEKISGVSLMLDDTPQTVVISCFDPIRRQIARQALVELIADGRIHPSRIEEALIKAEEQIQKQIKQYGEEAAFKTGVLNLHPELISLLGRLKFRFSLGQNVLDHSIEVAHLMGLMASELNLNISLAKRIGLLHDIGKAVSHEISGSHAKVGHDLSLKYQESKEVANGIGSHHFEMEPITIEGSLCASADAISASRPGARIEAVEEYIKRLGRLESLALEFPGVEKAYALQAGREIQVIAFPDQLTDEGVYQLAKDITKKIEMELDYPGKIKVSVYREKRVVDYAM